MWKQAAIPLAMMLALAGCSGDGSNPFDDDDDSGSGGGGSSITVPADIAGNVTSMAYNASKQTLTVTGVSLDDVPFEAVYTRQVDG